jgi:hypothetical protein
MLDFKIYESLYHYHSPLEWCKFSLKKVIFLNISDIQLESKLNIPSNF